MWHSLHENGWLQRRVFALLKRNLAVPLDTYYILVYNKFVRLAGKAKFFFARAHTRWEIRSGSNSRCFNIWMKEISWK